MQRLAWLILMGLAAVTAALGSFAPSLTIDGSPASLLPAGDPARHYWDEARKQFGGDQVVAVGVIAPDVFAPATLDKIARLTEGLRVIDGIVSVSGPTTVARAVAEGDRWRLQPQLDTMPRTDEESTALRAAMLANPLARKSAFAADGTAAVVTAELDPARAAEWGALDARIRAVVDPLRGPETFAIAGPPALVAEAERQLRADLTALVAAALVIAAVAALFALRSARGVIVSLAAVAVALVWTAGAMVLMGQAVTIATLPVLPLLVVIGVAYPLSIVARFDYERLSGRPAPEVVAVTMTQARTPVAVAALCTLIGVGSLCFSTVSAVRAFGLCSALSTAVALVVGVTLVPALLAVLPIGASAAHGKPHVVGRGLERLGALTMRHRAAVVLLGLAAVGLGAWGLTRLRAENGWLTYFPPDGGVRRDEALIAGRVGGTQTLSVVVEGDGPGSIGRREALRALRDLEREIAQQPGVDKTYSLLDYLTLLQGTRSPGGSTKLPRKQEEIDALLQHVDANALRDVVSADFARTRLIVRTGLSNSAELHQLVDHIERFATPSLLQRGFGRRTRFPRGFSVQVTGSAVVAQRGAARLAAEQRPSIVYAALALCAVASLVFLSPRVGLLAVSLNAGSVIILYGLMGWSGAGLTALTACLPGLVLGVTVGHTLHYLSACNSLVGRPGCPPEALVGVITSVGRPIAAGALALIGGLLAFTAAHMPPLQWFGLLGAAAVALALCGNLLLLATRVLTTRIITITELLFTRMGPLEEIPLFAGLHPFQAKIVVLTGHLATVGDGERITRRGELKQELYVLLSGNAEVRPEADGPAIGTLARGDVIGEMGLVRELPRSADVVATELTEYLVLDGSFLDRLRRQYPRIAALLLFNLTRILSDRLERTSARLAEVSAAAGIRA